MSYDSTVHYRVFIGVIYIKCARNFFFEKNGWLFEIWTEQELGFEDSKQITKWADDHIKERTGIDYSVVRKKKSCMKVKRHYRTHIANDKVTLFCSFCNKEHTPLRLTHDKNIARNGRYICEREGGQIAGSRPKPHLRKDNPHAADGKKECISCLQILEFKLFSPDNTKIAFYGKDTITGFYDIFLMDSDGSNIVNLTNDALEDYSPHWSPDGNWLAFTRGNSDNYDIWILNIHTKEFRRLTTQPKRDETPFWLNN